MISPLSIARRAALVCCAAPALSCGVRGGAPPDPRSLSVEQWREDLRYFARELPKRHKNLFHTMTREDFERSVARLDSAIPTLEPHQIVVRMKQITAKVGDGHTGLQIPNSFALYPIVVYWFGSELRVTAAMPEYRRAVGARIVGIGGLEIDEVERRIETTFPSAQNENPWYVLSTSTAHIARPEILHALGIVKDMGVAPFTFADDEGRQFTLEVRSVPPPPVVNRAFTLTGLVPASARQPLYRQRPAETFWFTYLPDSQTVYVSFRGYRSLGDRTRELFEALDRKLPQRLIIDMRQNDGGDFYVGRRNLIEPLKRRPQLNQKGRLFVVIGRRTFSAAMANAIDFRKETNAILVGEPIGERPNSYSENDEMTLPNSRIVVSYSTRYYRFLDEDAPAVMPDVRIDPTWPEWAAGRDSVLDWIVSQRR